MDGLAVEVPAAGQEIERLLPAFAPVVGSEKAALLRSNVEAVFVERRIGHRRNIAAGGLQEVVRFVACRQGAVVLAVHVLVQRNLDQVRTRQAFVSVAAADKKRMLRARRRHRRGNPDELILTIDGEDRAVVGSVQQIKESVGGAEGILAEDHSAVGVEFHMAVVAADVLVATQNFAVAGAGLVQYLHSLVLGAGVNQGRVGRVGADVVILGDVEALVGDVVPEAVRFLEAVQAAVAAHQHARRTVRFGDLGQVHDVGVQVDLFVGVVVPPAIGALEGFAAVGAHVEFDGAEGDEVGVGRAHVNSLVGPGPGFQFGHFAPVLAVVVAAEQLVVGLEVQPQAVGTRLRGRRYAAAEKLIGADRHVAERFVAEAVAVGLQFVQVHLLVFVHRLHHHEGAAGARGVVQVGDLLAASAVGARGLVDAVVACAAVGGAVDFEVPVSDGEGGQDHAVRPGGAEGEFDISGGYRAVLVVHGGVVPSPAVVGGVQGLVAAEADQVTAPGRGHEAEKSRVQFDVVLHELPAFRRVVHLPDRAAVGQHEEAVGVQWVLGHVVDGAGRELAAALEPFSGDEAVGKRFRRLGAGAVPPFFVAGHGVAGLQFAPVRTGGGGVQAFFPGFAGGFPAFAVGLAVQADVRGGGRKSGFFGGAAAGAEEGNKSNEGRGESHGVTGYAWCLAKISRFFL